MSPALMGEFLVHFKSSLSGCIDIITLVAFGLLRLSHSSDSSCVTALNLSWKIYQLHFLSVKRDFGQQLLVQKT